MSPVTLPLAPHQNKTFGAVRPKSQLSARQSGVLIFLGAAFWVATYLGAIRISSFPLAENPENLAGVLLATVFVLTRLGRVRLWAGPAKFFLIYFGVTAVLALGRYAMDREFDPMRIYFQYAQAFLLYLIFYDLCRDPHAARVLVLTFLGATIALSLIANFGLGGVVGAAQAGRGGVAERVGVLGMNLNYQAFLYAAGVIGVLCHGIARWPRFGWKDWLLAAGATSMLLALLRTGSRGGLVTLTVGVAAALALQFRGRRWAAYALLVPVVLYGIGSAIMSSEVIRARIEDTLYGGDLGARDVLARGAFDMFKERPLTGAGTDYIEELGARLGRERIAAHNTYLQIACAFGLAGFLPWLAGLVATGFRLWRFRSNVWAVAMLVILIAMIAAMVPGNFAYGRFKWVFLALAGAMPFAPPLPVKRPRGAPTVVAGVRRPLPGRSVPLRSGAGSAR